MDVLWQSERPWKLSQTTTQNLGKGKHRSSHFEESAELGHSGRMGIHVF